MFEEEISNQKEILYEVFREYENSSNDKYVFMIIDQSYLSLSLYLDISEKKKCKKLRNIIGAKFSFTKNS